MSVRAPRLRETFEALAIAAGEARASGEIAARAKKKFDDALVKRAHALDAMRASRKDFDAAVEEFVSRVTPEEDG